MKMNITVAVEVIEGDGSTGRIKLGCDKSGIGDKGYNAYIKKQPAGRSQELPTG
jgi:hypothetical protein